jgi:hypothetical protein
MDEGPMKQMIAKQLIAKLISLALAAAIVAAAAAAGVGPSATAAEHKCDPVTDEGWSVVPERQTLSEVDGKPYRAGADWFIDRTTTVLPFCHYYNSLGVYSLRSYSLAPVETEERIAICRGDGQGGSVAVPPYTGPCPPRSP